MSATATAGEPSADADNTSYVKLRAAIGSPWLSCHDSTTCCFVVEPGIDPAGRPFTGTQWQPAAVYRAFSAAGHLLYVGCTVDLEQRQRTQRIQRPEWGEVVRVDATRYPHRWLALYVEALAIRAESPLWNRQRTQPPTSLGNKYPGVDDCLDGYDTLHIGSDGLVERCWYVEDETDPELDRNESQLIGRLDFDAVASEVRPRTLMGVSFL